MKDTGRRIYGEAIRKDIVYVHKCVTKKWMERQHDNRVVNYWQISDHHSMANPIRVEEIDDDGYIEDENTMRCNWELSV